MAEASIDAQKRCGLCVYCVTLACQSLKIIDASSAVVRPTARRCSKTNNDVRTLISVISVPVSAVKMLIGLREVECHKDEHPFHLLSAIYCESSVFL